MKPKTLNLLFACVFIVLAAAITTTSITMKNGNVPAGSTATNEDDLDLHVTQTLAVILQKTKQADAAATATPESRATPSPEPTITPFVPPDSYFITGIFGTRQYFALGCEASAAADWASYFGVLIYEYDFQHQLPLSDNPDLGYVGDAKGPWGQVPPYAYGVHAEPVAQLLREYGLKAVAAKELSLEQIKIKIAQSKPVIAWVIGNMEGGVPAEYTDKLGNKTIVAAYEHVVILTGYDQDSIRYMNNGKFYEVPNEVFLNSWGVLGNMAVMHE